MTRHSKNNTALGFFTNAERSKLTYGTQSQRLGRDSMRPIDSCVLCLQTARNPVCCVKGHLYCKECVVENIITQKKEIEREEKAVLIHNQTVETEEERKARLEHERKVQEFISQETQVKSTLETGKKERELKSFWIPQLQPEANPELAKVSKSTPQCVAGKAAHNLSLKKLITVKFTEKGEGDEMQKICPVCVKSVKLGMEMSVIKPCGHVLCNKCIDQFIKKTAKCPTCDTKCKEKDVLQIASEGTGFSSAGHIDAKKVTPAFTL